LDAFKLVTQKEGGKGLGELYSGYWENISYAYPADVIKFLCYDSLSGGRKNLPPAQGAVYGAVATAVAQLITTPLDVVRNRIMAGEEQAVKGGDSESGSESSSSASYVDKLITLAREEGLEGLFAGATPRVGKALLSGAIQFATYEETKQAINRFLEEKFGGT
jgi:solute carrier family 25 S-adenosylmethionine transporter 26